MGILSRLFRLCKADVHGVMDQLEDKELVLKQYLREMEESLKLKELRLARLDDSIRQISGDLKLRREELQKLETDLELAVGKDKDDIARMLIRKRRTIQGGADLMAQRLSGVEEESARLNETLDRQRLQYAQFQVKVAGYCRRAELNSNETYAMSMEPDMAWNIPTEEEIELELIQRKQSLQPGGAP